MSTSRGPYMFFLVPDSIFKTNCKLVFLQGFHQTYQFMYTQYTQLPIIQRGFAILCGSFSISPSHLFCAEKRPSPAASPKAKAPAEPAPKQAGRRGPGQHPSRASQAASSSSSTAVPPEACKWRPERKP